MKLQIAPLAVTALLTWAGNAVAGVILTTKGSDAKSNEESTIYLEGNKMRVDSNRDPEHKTVFIYDGDKQMLITVDPQKKMQEGMAKMTPEQRKQMEAAMGQLSPEQRKRMQDMMGGRTPSQDASPETAVAPAKWERTGSEQTVAGYSCQGFKEIKGGKTKATGCYIPWSGSAITKADIAPLL